MNKSELLTALKRTGTDAHRCLGCGYEHNCNIHGCVIINEAIRLIEELEQDNIALKKKQGIPTSDEEDVEDGEAYPSCFTPEYWISLLEHPIGSDGRGVML